MSLIKSTARLVENRTDLSGTPYDIYCRMMGRFGLRESSPGRSVLWMFATHDPTLYVHTVAYEKHHPTRL